MAPALVVLLHFVACALHNVAAQEGGNSSSAAHPPVGRWQTAAAMHERREYPGGVPLHDGRILAVSGHPLGGKSLASAELYNSALGEWVATG